MRSYVDPQAVEPLVDTLVDDRMDDLQKADSIFDWVTSHIPYGYEEIVRKDRDYGMRTPSEVLEDGEGMCFEQAALFLSLAEAVGIDEHELYLIEDSDGVETDRYCHFIPALLDGRGVLHTYDVTGREKGSINPYPDGGEGGYPDTWTLIKAGDTPALLARFEDRKQEMDKRINNHTTPMKFITYEVTCDEGSLTVHDFHNLRTCSQGPIINRTLMYVPRGSTVYTGKEELNAYFEPGSDTPSRITYSSNVDPRGYEEACVGGSLELSDEGPVFSGDGLARERIEELYDSLEGIPVTDIY